MPITLHTEEMELPVQDKLAVGRFRDEFQLKIDSEVRTLKVNTASAGWPEPDPSRLFLRYVVDAGDVTEMKGVIRRAGTLLKVTPDFYTDAKTEAGLVVIKFHVSRKTDKDGKPVTDDTLTDDGKPKPDAEAAPSAATATSDQPDPAPVKAGAPKK